MSAVITIDSVQEKIGRTTFEAKKNTILSQDRIDEFLDSILTLKEHLKVHSSKLTEIVELVEQLTWIDKTLTESDEFKIHDIITKLRDYYSSMNRHLFYLKKFSDKRIAGKEINEFRRSVNDIREAYQDLETVYFDLPQIEDFQEAQKIIHSI